MARVRCPHRSGHPPQELGLRSAAGVPADSHRSPSASGAAISRRPPIRGQGAVTIAPRPPMHALRACQPAVAPVFTAVAGALPAWRGAARAEGEVRVVFVAV